MSAPPLPVLPPHLLIRESQLTFGGELGRGSFGAVHRGTLNGQPVCIKVTATPHSHTFRVCGLCPLQTVIAVLAVCHCVVCWQSFHALRDPELYGLVPDSPEEKAVIAELMKEVGMLAGLHHDRVVCLRGLCMDAVTGKPKFIALELANGGSLASYLQQLKSQGKSVSLQQFTGFSEDCLSGMNYLHTLEPCIIHRDLKPENVLVFLVRSGPVLKLGDVGLARFSSTMAATSSAVLSTRTAGVGSPFYMAPEVLFGEYDARADVFSFGVMMAEVVHVYMACKPMVPLAPEGRLSMIRSAVAHLKEHCEPLSALLSKCCEKKEDLRISSSQALTEVSNVSMGSAASEAASVAPVVAPVIEV